MNPDSTAALFAGSQALGQISGTDGGAFAMAAPALGPVLLKLGLGLGAVIVLILVLQRFARRFGGGLPRGGNPIQLLAQRPLGPRLSLAVVEVMDRTFLVGVSPHGIEKVADLTSARARQNAARALAIEARGMERGHATQMAGNDDARADDLAGLGWKERLVRSFAQVLSGGRIPSDPRGDGRSTHEGPARKYAQQVSPAHERTAPEYAQQVSPAHERTAPEYEQTVFPAHERTAPEYEQPTSLAQERSPLTHERTARTRARTARAVPDAPRDAAPSGPSAFGEAGFEVEFKRRLEELKTRYPQVSEIDAQPRRGTR